MDPIVLAYASFPILLVLIFLRVPIGPAMLVVGLGWLVAECTAAPRQLLNQMKTLAMQPVSSHSAVDRAAVPADGAVPRRWAGCPSRCSRPPKPSRPPLRRRRRDGRGRHCASFGAICGSSLATAATMGQVALPELKRAPATPAARPRARSAAGGTLGIQSRRRSCCVIYAILAEQNIAKLFAAAFVPRHPGSGRLRWSSSTSSCASTPGSPAAWRRCPGPSGCARSAPSGR